MQCQIDNIICPPSPETCEHVSLDTIIVSPNMLVPREENYLLLLCADKRATETLVIESEFQKPFIMYAQTIWPWSYLDLAI